MQSRLLLPVLVMLTLVLSGCSGGAPKGSASPSPTFATQATVTDETGGIEGKVLDEESRPIAGAQVGVLRASAQPITTNALGAFAFSELAAGKHDIVVSAIGFLEAGVSVEVVPGEIANVTISLKERIIEAPVNVLSAAQNTVYLHANYGPPNTYWANTIVGVDETHDPPHNRDCVGYNSLGFVVGTMNSQWTAPFSPDPSANVRLDKSKPVYVRLFLCPFGGEDTTGTVTVSFSIANGDKVVVAGEGKQVNLAGPNAFKVEWEVTPELDLIQADSGLEWTIVADGYYVPGLGLGACMKCEAQSSITFPVL